MGLIFGLREIVAVHPHGRGDNYRVNRLYR